MLVLYLDMGIGSVKIFFTILLLILFFSLFGYPSLKKELFEIDYRTLNLTCTIHIVDQRIDFYRAWHLLFPMIDHRIDLYRTCHVPFHIINRSQDKVLQEITQAVFNDEHFRSF